MTELNLKKPLAFFDLETTGLDIAKDRIVEISIYKVLANGQTQTYTQVFNPEIPISPEASAIHGFHNEDVKDKPTFKSLAKELVSFFGNSDLAGYNVIRFDLPLLAEEFLRADIMFEIDEREIIDVQNIFHKMEARTLSAAYKFYCGKELINAHSAESDTLATYEVLLSQIEKYKDAPYTHNNSTTFPIENDVKALSKFSLQKKFVDLAGNVVMNEKDIPVFNFGKHKNKPVHEVFTKEPQYYDWIIKSNFPEYTKRVFKKLYFEKYNNNDFKLL